VIDAVAIGMPDGGDDDPESNLATRLQNERLAGMTTIWRLPANTLPALAKYAKQAASGHAMSPQARILLLRDPLILPAPGCLEALARVIDAGANCACPASRQLLARLSPPDYLTLRGFERYADRLAALASTPVQPLPCGEEPTMALTLLKCLGDDSWRNQAVQVPTAWAHDFSGYRQHRREEIIPLVPPGVRRILDVGGGEGGFLRALKATRPLCETHLAEAHEPSCQLAAVNADYVWRGDFLEMTFDRSFDCICFLDVLEHAVEPERYLAHALQYLDARGSIVLSIPNVGHWSVIADLLEGRWDYAPAGIHCISHLRFFTPKGVRELLNNARLVIEREARLKIPPPPWFEPSSLQGPLSIDQDSLETYALCAVAQRSC